MGKINHEIPVVTIGQDGVPLTRIEPMDEEEIARRANLLHNIRTVLGALTTSELQTVHDRLTDLPDGAFYYTPVRRSGERV